MTTKLQSLTELWQEFNLTGTQKLLDELATEISTKQDESDVSRKQLIELIRSFKKSNSEETRLVVAPLLKNFQNEIDMLSKRSKSAEKAFFDIYKKFCDIADPVPTLEYCMDNMKNLQRLQDLEIENNQLRETMGDFNKEITEYKEKTKNLKDVEEKLETQEKNMDETIEKKIKSREEDLINAFNEKIKIIEEEKLRNENKLIDSERKQKQLQSVLDECQNELFELKSRQDTKRNALSDEMDLMMTDLERANQRAVTAEKEVIALQESISELKENLNNDDVEEAMHDEDTSELKLQLHAKEKEVVQLVEDVQKANKVIQDNEAKYERKISSLEKSIGDAEQVKDELELKLSKQSDYENIKKDLSILKTLEFPSHSMAEDDNRPLEVLILERSKTLQSDNSMLRQDKERLLKEVNSSKTELSEAQMKLDKQTELISQLEEHVEQLQAISTPYREEAEGRSSSDMLAEALKIDTVEEVFERDSSVSPSPIGNLMSPSTLYSPGDTSSTLLPIIKAQRERFRLRNEELESANLQQQHQLSTLNNQMLSLQQDNVKLYEKIRFLQACGGSGSGRKQGDTVVPVENRYQGEYEQKLDPFQTFSQAEKKRKYGQLSVIEKVILSLIRFMVSNKTVRLMVTFYSILLHGLVFAVLYKLAMTESCKHDMAARWHEKYIEHMQDVHGDSEHIG